MAIKEHENKEYNIFKQIKKFKNLKNEFDNIWIDVGIEKYKIITLYKIKSKYYDYDTYLRKYIPYIIRWDINKNYYILNRDYEYIGLNSKDIDFSKSGEKYLFDDGTKPWNKMDNYSKVCNKYKQIINDHSLKECLNENYLTRNILN